MSLSPNVYRRGGIYWWRRRFVVSTKGSKTVALSLKVRDPYAARIIGSKLNAEAGLLARQMELRMSTFEEGRAVLEAIAMTPFAVADDAFASFKPRPKADAGCPTYSADEERAMLVEMARETEARFREEAIFNRSHHGLDDLGRSFDIVATAIASENAIGFVYKYVGERGTRAAIDAVDRAEMTARGLSQDLIGSVERDVVYYARREDGQTWHLGPDRAYFAAMLIKNGVTPNDANIARLRRAYLPLCAEILFDAKERYANSTPPISDVLAFVRSERKASRSTASAAETTARQPDLQETTIASTASDAPIVAPATTATPVAVPETTALVAAKLVGEIPSFVEKIEAFAKRKVKAKLDNKKDGWMQKTADQHTSIAKLFTKLAGTDDPRLLTQAHVGAYRDLLDDLPKSHGKSVKDQYRSIDEILARCQDLEDTEVGLEGGTVNRHLTQLNNCMEVLRGHGFNIGVITNDMRADDTPKERAPFTIDDRLTLFGSKTWTGDDIIHGSQFFVPIIGAYECMRLSEITGLATADVDLDRSTIHVRENKYRGVKSKEATRDLPIMAELERVGFCEYVEAMARAGHDLLFADLRLRGAATALSNLYYKEWFAILSRVLPHAQGEHKSFHSWRKTGNTEMVAKNVNDALRCQIMGHAYRDVNGRNYTADVSIEDKRVALAHISITTSAIRKVPLRLHNELGGI